MNSVVTLNITKIKCVDYPKSASDKLADEGRAQRVLHPAHLGDDGIFSNV